MRVYKFGGASVKNAEAVQNVARIVGEFDGDTLVVVVSAMGKITNKLEELIEAYYHENEPLVAEIISDIRAFHFSILDELINKENSAVYDEVENLLIEVECLVETRPEVKDYDFLYDQIIVYGELISTRIISYYMNRLGVKNRWLDARNFIVTSSDFRQGKVDWGQTSDLIDKQLRKLANRQLVVTQGFIARSDTNANTSLGREGSDYSAAILAYGLDAESVTIWKDVEGLMNADPKRVAGARVIPEISYSEAIELAYYGATVIHPKTIQPLQNKGIPLYVKSFLNPDKKGTVIRDNERHRLIHTPCYIIRDEQSLISVSTKDFSFIVEEHLSRIFELMAETRIQANVIQNTAISFSLCCSTDSRSLDKFVTELEKEFYVKHKDNLKLLTIFNPGTDVNQVPIDLANVVLEQRTAVAHQYLLENLPDLDIS
jgi:aspartate kinase